MRAARVRLLAYFCLVLAIIVLTALPGSAQVTLVSGTRDFGAQGVGVANTTTLTFSFSSDTILGGAPAVVTQGYSGLDFTSPSGTCLAGQWFASNTCIVNVTFTPSYPGLRMGAVVFKDISGTVVATTYLQGVGSGPLPTISPAVSWAIGFSFRPMGVALDAAGYSYLLDPGDANHSGALRQLSPDGNQLALLAAGFTSPVDAAVDGAGNAYVADSGAGSVWKVTPDGLKTQIIPSTTLDPNGLAVDGAGNLYIADRNTQSVLMVAPDGSQSTAASNFEFLVGPMAVDGAGDIYVSDAHTCSIGFCTTVDYVWKVTPGGVRTQAWTGTSQATGVALDGVGDVYVVDASGIVWVVQPGQAQGQLNTGVTPWNPRKIAVDGAGSAYITDVLNNQLYKFAGASFFPIIISGTCGAANGGTFNAAPATDLCSAGTASTVTGSGPWSWSCTGLNGGSNASCSATLGAGVKFLTAPPALLPVGSNAGTVVVAIEDASGSVVTGSTAAVTLTVTGLAGYSQTYTANAVNGLVSFDLSAATLTVADTYTYTASSAGLAPATAIEMVAAGKRVQSSSAIISTLAGTDIAGYNGDNIPATTAQLNNPSAIGLDSFGNAYIADTGNFRIRVVCVTSSGAFCNGMTPGNIYTVAGTGSAGDQYYNDYVVDNTLATTAALSIPRAVVLDGAGNLYILSRGIYKVDAATHKITNFAAFAFADNIVCTGEIDGVGDGCPATSSYVSQGVEGLTVDAAGDVFFSGDGLIRVVCAAGGSSPFCSGGTPGYIYTAAGCWQTISGVSGGNWTNSGNYCEGTQDYNLGLSNALALDSAGNLYFGGAYSNLFYKDDAATRHYTVVAGGGDNWCNGAQTDQFFDGCPATSLAFGGHDAITMDSSNNLYLNDDWATVRNGQVVDAGLIRKVDAATQIVSLVAGSAPWLGVCSGATNAIGDGCPATSGGQLARGPAGTALDAFGNVYIVDQGNNRIRKVTMWLPAPAFNIPASQTINVGTASITLSGTIAGGTVRPHDAETVTITINGVSVSAPITGGNFSTTFNTSALPGSATPYAITYAYAGDDVLASASDSSTALTVSEQLAGTTVTLVSSANPSYPNQQVTFTATVRPVGQGLPTPTGTVTLIIGGLQGAIPMTLNGGTATATLSLPQGSWPVLAGYGGDDKFSPSSTNLSQNVQLTGATVTLVSSANPSYPNQQVTFTATVTPVGQGLPTPTGTVTLIIGGLQGAIPMTLNGGTATATLSLPQGSWPVLAGYGGDDKFSPSSTNLSQNVQLTGATVTLVSSANPSYPNQQVTFTATVTPVGQGLPTPTGTVTLIIGGLQGAIPMTLNGGTATATLSLPQGSWPVLAGYGGDDKFSPSSAPALSQGVSYTPPAASSVSIAALDPIMTQAGSGDFTLHVYGGGFSSTSQAAPVIRWAGSARPTTFVSATELTATISAADVVAAGQVAVTVSNPDGSLSPAFWFAIDSSTGASAVVTADSLDLQALQGQSVITHVTFQGVSASQVTATCLNLPTGASCTYQDSTRTLTIVTSSTTPKGTYEVTVIFKYTKQLLSLARGRMNLAMNLGMGLPLGLLWAGCRRKRRMYWLVLTMLSVLLLSTLVGCGGSSSTSSSTTTNTQSSVAVMLNVH